MTQELHVIIGSTSDDKAALPGLKDFTSAHPDIRVRIHYASADNTPKKVNDVYAIVRGSQPVGPKVYISGAGMANILTGVIKNYAGLMDLVIGVPFSDKTGGLASLLSTAEKPPRNDVLAVGVDDTYAACNIARKWIARHDHRVVVLDIDEDGAADKPADLLDKYGIVSTVCAPDDIGSDDLVIAPFSWPDQLHEVSNVVSRGMGVVIGVPQTTMGIDSPANTYGGESIGFVGQEMYHNAVLLAARFLRDEEAVSKMYEEKRVKAEALADHKGLIVEAGAVSDYRGE